VFIAGPRRPEVEYANAKAVPRQIDVEPADAIGGRSRTGPRTAHRRVREDRDSILVFGWMRRLDVWQSPLPHRGAQGHTGTGAEFRCRNHIGVVGGDFFSDACSRL